MDMPDRIWAYRFMDSDGNVEKLYGEWIPKQPKHPIDCNKYLRSTPEREAAGEMREAVKEWRDIEGEYLRALCDTDVEPNAVMYLKRIMDEAKTKIFDILATIDAEERGEG